MRGNILSKVEISGTSDKMNPFFYVGVVVMALIFIAVLAVLICHFEKDRQSTRSLKVDGKKEKSNRKTKAKEYSQKSKKSTKKSTKSAKK